MFKTVALKDFPKLKAIVKLADPNYRKRKVFVQTEVAAELSNTYWDEGSRSTYHGVRLDPAKREVKAFPQYDPPQFGGPRTAPTMPLEPGYVVVETGFFCGKVSTATIHMHPEDTEV